MLAGRLIFAGGSRQEDYSGESSLSFWGSGVFYSKWREKRYRVLDYSTLSGGRRGTWTSSSIGWTTWYVDESTGRVFRDALATNKVVVSHSYRGYFSFPTFFATLLQCRTQKGIIMGGCIEKSRRDLFIFVAGAAGIRGFSFDAERFSVIISQDPNRKLPTSSDRRIGRTIASFKKLSN